MTYINKFDYFEQKMVLYSTMQFRTLDHHILHLGAGNEFLVILTVELEGLLGHVLSLHGG